MELGRGMNLGLRRHVAKVGQREAELAGHGGAGHVPRTFCETPTLATPTGHPLDAHWIRRAQANPRSPKFMRGTQSERARTDHSKI